MAAFSLPPYLTNAAVDRALAVNGAFVWGEGRLWSQLYETERMVYMEFHAEIRNNVRVMPENTDFIPNWATEPSERALQLIADGNGYHLGPRGQITDGQWNAMMDWLQDEETGDGEEDSDEESSGEEDEGEENEGDESSSESSEDENQVSPWPSSDEEDGEEREWPRIDLTSNMEWLPAAEIETIRVTIN